MEYGQNIHPRDSNLKSSNQESVRRVSNVNINISSSGRTRIEKASVPLDFDFFRAALLLRRNIKRLDLLKINQCFLSLGQVQNPLQETFSQLLSKFLSRRYHAVFLKIAHASDTTQRLTYFNATQAARETICFLMLTCMVEDRSYTQKQQDAIQEEIDFGVMAMALRYYRADFVPTNSGRVSATPETYYYDFAIEDGLLHGLSNLDKTKIRDILTMTCQSYRENETFSEQALIFRNASDAVVMPFAGISFELNLESKVRMDAQSARGIGEKISYLSTLRSSILPVGNARKTAIETFIHRMVYYYGKKNWRAIVGASEEDALLNGVHNEPLETCIVDSDGRIIVEILREDSVPVVQSVSEDPLILEDTDFSETDIGDDNIGNDSDVSSEDVQESINDSYQVKTGE